MIELIIFLWIVGHMFTAGIFGSKPTTKRIVDNLVLLVSWPFLLGVFVRELVDKSDRTIASGAKHV